MDVVLLRRYRRLEWRLRLRMKLRLLVGYVGHMLILEVSAWCGLLKQLSRLLLLVISILLCEEVGSRRPIYILLRRTLHCLWLTPRVDGSWWSN